MTRHPYQIAGNVESGGEVMIDWLSRGHDILTIGNVEKEKIGSFRRRKKGSKARLVHWYWILRIYFSRERIKVLYIWQNILNILYIHPNASTAHVSICMNEINCNTVGYLKNPILDFHHMSLFNSPMTDCIWGFQACSDSPSCGYYYKLPMLS